MSRHVAVCGEGRLSCPFRADRSVWRLCSWGDAPGYVVSVLWTERYDRVRQMSFAYLEWRVAPGYVVSVLWTQRHHQEREEIAWTHRGRVTSLIFDIGTGGKFRR